MDDKTRWTAINEIVTVCRRMWQRGYVANHDGNVTVKIDDQFLATPTAVSKADVSPEIILTLGADGTKIAGPGKSFSEINLHLVAYSARPFAKAVVHAHPPYATARGACGMAFDKTFIPEAIVSIGDAIPVVPFFMPGTKEGENAVTEALKSSPVIMIAGNGVLAVGDSALQAYLRIELLEHLAKMDFIAKNIGSPFELTEDNKAKLVEKHRATFSNHTKVDRPVQEDYLRKIIADEIRSVLGERSSRL